VNPLAPQDHVPLGITWGASRLLKLVAALVRPVPLDVVVVSEQTLTAPCLVKRRNLLPRLSPIGQLLLNHQDQQIHLVIRLALRPGHGNHDNRLIAELHLLEKIVRSLATPVVLYAFMQVYTLYKRV